VLGQQLLAGLGLAVGVALLFSSQISSASLSGLVQNATSGLVGQMQLQLDARDQRGFDEQLLQEVRRLPGVRAAVPALEEPVTLTGSTGQRTVELIGVNPLVSRQYSRLPRRLRRAFIGVAEGGLALPSPVATQIGARSSWPLKLWFNGITKSTFVGARLDAQTVGDLVDSPVAVALLRYMQRITGMKRRITRIFVQTAAGREREARASLVRLAAGSLNVAPASFDATLFGVAAAPANQSESLFSGISALVGFMFAFNAMLLTLPVRRSLIRILRNNGAGRRDIVKVLLCDALVLGVVASLIGLALGDVLSLSVFRATPNYLSLAFPVGSQRIVSWQSISIASAVGLLVACVGVLVAMRGSSLDRVRKPAARGSVRRRAARSLLGGTLLVALTTAILVAAPQAAVVGCVALLLALLLSLPPLLDGSLDVFDRVQRRFRSASTRVAVSELRAPSIRARSIAIAATAATAVFGSVALQGAQANVRSGLDRSAHDVATSSDIWIIPSNRQDTLATTWFHQDPPLPLARVPGVRAVGEYRATLLDYGDRRLWVLAPPDTTADPVPASQLLDGSLPVAMRRMRMGGWAVVSKAVAEQHHLHIGQRFTLPSPRPTTFRVAALSTNLGWAPGAVILNSADYEKGWGSEEISGYAVTLAPHASADAVRHRLSAALPSKSGLVVETAHQRELGMRTLTRQGLARLTQIATLVQIATILAIAAAMGAMVWQRRPRLARIGIQGYSRGVLWRSLVCEATMLLGGGSVIGAAFGVYGGLLISHALATVTGFPIVFSAGVRVAVVVAAIVSLAAIAMVAILGYRAVSPSAGGRDFPATTGSGDPQPHGI
jgi:putative ABC transport system permease protein